MSNSSSNFNKKLMSPRNKVMSLDFDLYENPSINPKTPLDFSKSNYTSFNTSTSYINTDSGLYSLKTMSNQTYNIKRR